MDYYVYAIKSLKDGRIYVGMTSNVEKRISQHNSGKTQSTKPYIPWKLFHLEKFSNRTEARQREKYLKGGSGKEYLKKILFLQENNVEEFNGKNTCLPAGRGVS